MTSSAYLRAELPGVTHIKSVELRMNRTGPRAKPCTTLALMGRGGGGKRTETGDVGAIGEEVNEPGVNPVREGEVCELGKKCAVAGNIEGFGKI